MLGKSNSGAVEGMSSAPAAGPQFRIVFDTVAQGAQVFLNLCDIAVI